MREGCRRCKGAADREWGVQTVWMGCRRCGEGVYGVGRLQTVVLGVANRAGGEVDDEIGVEGGV